MSSAASTKASYIPIFDSPDDRQFDTSVRWVCPVAYSAHQYAVSSAQFPGETRVPDHHAARFHIFAERSFLSPFLLIPLRC